MSKGTSFTKRQTVAMVKASFDNKTIEGPSQLTVELSGWVHRIRQLKQVVFIVLRDRTGLVQCTLTPSQYEALGQPLTLETVVWIKGLASLQKNKLQNFEIIVDEIETISSPESEIPVQINIPNLDVNLDTLLNHRVLTLRHLKEQATFRIQSYLVEAFSEGLRQKDFVQIFSPKLVKEGAEGGANVFCLDYFDTTAYLAQSPQFYKQMMVIAGFERVFEIGPVFRAEAHSTSRHLNEYISLDIEMGFINSEQDLMALETDLLRFMIDQVHKRAKNELDNLEVTLPQVPPVIPQVDFNDALDILDQHFQRKDLDGDLDPDAERQLCAYFKETTGSEFLFVTNYPRRKRPMYAMPLGDTGTKSFDLLFRGLEITTGGMRLHKRQELEANMRYKGLDPSAYSTYLMAFDHGVPPHGGFAIGLERLTAQLLGYNNIRRTCAFPRDGQRLVP